MCKDSRAISQAVEAMITRLNSQEDLAEIDLVCLTCLRYALMWVSDTNPSRNGTISEVVRFDLDDLSKEGGEMQSVLSKALAGAKSEVQQDVLAILKSRGLHVIRGPYATRTLKKDDELSSGREQQHRRPKRMASLDACDFGQIRLAL